MHNNYTYLQHFTTLMFEWLLRHMNNYSMDTNIIIQLGHIMKQKIFFIVITHFFLLFLSPNIQACDNKSCENNYLVSTNKYKNNSVHQATTSQKEKAKYSANYKRQQIALVNVRRAHALNQARRKFASKNRFNITHQKISVMNEQRAHALNRARKGYALSHLKQRRQMLLHAKAQKTQPVSNRNRQGLAHDVNNFNKKYQKLANTQVKKRKPRYSKRNRVIASNKNKQSTNRVSRQKARKARANYLQEQESQRLANLKKRRAITLERERKDYARNQQRRNLAKTTEKTLLDLNKAI